MSETRINYVKKNVKWGYICTGLTYLLGFLLRTVIIRVMGEKYAGVNGLFTNILGVLSFAELGFGTALNYSLYDPVARNDNDKIKRLMGLYKRVYEVVACTIAIIGIILIPFLHYLINEPNGLENVEIYYCIYLFTTVTSYFVSYKYSLVNAKQENYLCSIINMVSTCFTYGFQIVGLIITKNFLFFLLIGAAVDLVQKIWISIYLNKRYPILKEKNVQMLPKNERQQIWKNTRALVFHKIGDVSVHQTDNIIISAFVSVSMVGRVSYYSYFVNAANQILLVALNSVVGTLGNLISQETTEKQYSIYKVYRFVAFWMYGYLSIGMYFMLNKVVRIFVGYDITLSNIIIFLLVLDFYMIGQRSSLNNMKMAGGVFQQDQYIAIVQAVVNLVVSIVLVQRMGLVGVYIGTIVQGLIASVIRPIIVYPNLFKQGAKDYFIDSIKYLGVIGLAGIVCMFTDKYIFTNSGLLLVCIEIIIISLVVNVIFFLVFRKTNEFIFLKNELIKRV